MQKKRLPSKVFSIVLSLLMILTVIPMLPAITAEAKYTTEYYYPAGTKFIKDVVICYYKNQGECIGNVRGAVGADGKVMDKDLTKGTGGDYYVYVGWTYTTNPNEAVRGFRIDHNGSVPTSWTQSGVTWYPINSGYSSWTPQLHSDHIVDLNKGAGGDDMKLYITKDPSFGPPLTDMWCTGSTTERDNYVNSGWKRVVTFQDNSYHIDVNKGAGGDDLFLVYTHNSTTVNTNTLRSNYNSTGGIDTTLQYTPASIARYVTARNNAKTIIDAFDSSVNQGCTNYNQTAINNAANELTASVNALATNLYLDAATNGGSPDQTVTVTVGKNTTGTVDLSKYTATKEGSDFAGWAKSSLATTGTTGTVTVGFNETYYALFGIELTANFHYLLADGTITTETKKVYAMNAATAGSVPLPSAKNVTLDGKTYTLLGWREDTKATINTINKTGVYTIYESDPVIDVYAVYSAPITFTQDVNKGTPEIEAEVQTQYINANTALTKTSHTFTVTDAAPTREAGEFLGWADTADATEAKYQAGYTFTTTEDVNIYAAYKMQYVDVEFIGADGSVISTQSIPYGDGAVAPAETPVKAYDETNHYVFSGWDKEFAEVKTDLTVTAQFDAVAHELQDEIVTEANCTEAGSKNTFCTGCDYRIENIEIPALGHSRAVDPGAPATCTTDGSTDYVTCLRCLAVLQERTVLPASGHNWVLDTAKPATCDAGGYEIWVCQNNTNHTEKRNETMPTGEHTEIVVKGYAADCLNNGLTDGTECLQCGAVLVPQNIILADGHNLIIDKAVAPTCENTGLTEGAHCADCDYVVAQEVVPALGHDWADFTAKAATCTEDGYTAGSKCRYCQEVRDSIVIPALNHNWEIIEHKATCTEDGYTEYKCAYNEKHNYIVKGEQAFGHKGGTATCNEQAICDNCKQPYGETTAHSYEAVVFAPTCTKEGYTEYTCTACGDTYQDDITATSAHIYDGGRVTVEATCDAEGVKTFTCINCDDAYTEVIPAKGHNVENWEVEGTEAHGDCADCGEHITADPEEVGLELPECERCGMVHRYNSGLFKYKGVYCSIVYFFRQIVNFFKGM